MTQYMQHIYPHIQTDNRLRNNNEIFDFHESLPPPPYRSQATNSDWKHEIIEISSLKNLTNKFGFAISGGIDNINGPWIIVTHIDSSSISLPNNGREQLRLFDRLLAINDINLNRIRHEDAVHKFVNARGPSIKLHVYRLNPRHIESIDVVFPSDTIEPSLGITLEGGLNTNIEDPGLFITYIDPYGFLASYNQFKLNDRLLEVKTNFTSANLQYLTHSKAVCLIRRICQDDQRVTFVVAHQ